MIIGLAIGAMPARPSEVAAVEPPAITWDAADKSANLALSNDDRTATAEANGARVKADHPRSTGKRMVAFRADTLNTTNVDAIVGIASPSLDMAEGSGYPGFSNDDAIAIDTSSGGTRIIAGENSYNEEVTGSLAQGGWLLVLYDFDNSRLWVRVDDNAFNAGLGAADPEAGTGGIDMFGHFSGDGQPFFAAWPYGGVQPAFTIDGGADYPHDVPAGWLWWPADS